MNLATRIKKIRELNGWKQADLAEALSITQQAYSSLEKGKSGFRLDTLRRLCEVMHIELAFLVSDSIPITESNLNSYGRKSLLEIISAKEQMQQKLEMYKYLFKQKKLSHLALDETCLAY
jgi:transcriptional regulator with XRE-family HTH domain